MKNIVLASASPRRKELLEKTGLSFEIVVSDCDENIDVKEPNRLVMELSKLKAMDVSRKCADSIIIGADTVVSFNGTIMGKPKSKEDAVEMIESFAGHTHQVYTGICLIVPGEKSISHDSELEKEISQMAENCDVYYYNDKCIINYCVRTDVDVVEITEKEIIRYVETGEPMDKAGAYAIQGLFAPYISSIKGDYYNVVGLPVCSLFHCLKLFMDE
ncbi:MAG: Maf family protein [Lachnospiraceae bacterium]|nr:Maf family protein [Lachnospiraceae bacterium]